MCVIAPHAFGRQLARSSGLFLYHVGLEDWTQVVGLGDERLYPLIHPDTPEKYIVKNLFNMFLWELACMYIVCIPGANRMQKRVFGSPEL